MIRFLRNIWNDKRGNSLILAAACMPLLVGAAGLATDTINWTLWKRELQRAADSAAIAGVYDRVAKGNTTDTEDVVLHDLELNHHTGIDLVSPDYPDISFPDDDGDKRDQVHVALGVRKVLPFSSMFMSAAPIIVAEATAATVPAGGEYCVIALDTSASAVGINIQGSTTLDLGDCSLIANSTNPDNAATNTGNGSSVIAHSLAAAGGVQHSKNWDVGSYDPYSPPIDDPFADLPVPTSCDETITVAKKDFPLNRPASDAGKTICINGGLTVQGVANLQSATYVINGGDLTMNSTGSSLHCTECTIIMTNFADRTKTGNVKLTGGDVSISAPTADDATYKGIAIYQDRLANDSGKKTQNQINGNNDGSVTGVIYFPNQSLLWNGGATVGTSDPVCTLIVGKRVEFSGNSAFALPSECGSAGIPQVGGGGRRVRLVA